MKASLVALLLLLAPLPAWADPEFSHPLTDHPLPPLHGLAAKPPFALLLWQRKDGRTMRRLGEAKLVELAMSNPRLGVYSVEVTGGPRIQEPPYGADVVRSSRISPTDFARLQARTPVIVTVDVRGTIQRVSQPDHWPTLSALDSRFGTTPLRRVPWYRRLFGW